MLIAKMTADITDNKVKFVLHFNVLSALLVGLPRVGPSCHEIKR